MDDSANNGESGGDDDAGADQMHALARRLGALEAVLVIERRLRKLHKETSETLRAQLAAQTALAAQAQQVAPMQPIAPTQPIVPTQQTDLTVLRLPEPSRFDADATILASAAPARSASAPLPLRDRDAGVAAALAPGFALFEYRIDALLGQGGFGITYLATDVNLNVKVAIKEYLPASFAQRAGDHSVAPRWPEDVALYQTGLDSFLVEARTLATFRHPNIVRVGRFFEAHRTAYMVLDYERGESLRAWWPRHAAMPEQDLLGLLQPLLDGLAVVHASGFLHCDIKPDNIYVRKDDGTLVLLDFGAARQAVGAAPGLSGVVTPGYAPIEQYADGAQGPATDLYALGATLYWMISGAKPPAAPQRRDGSASMQPAAQVGQGRYGVPFLRALDWALEIDPARRPQSVQQLMHSLYADHAASLVLQDALRVGEVEAGPGRHSWRTIVDTPGLLKRHALHLGQALLRPASWPLMVKMSLAMVLAALLPMLITANYNLSGSVTALSGAELRNLERLAQSTAGRVGQLLADSRHLANYLATDDDFIAYLRQPDAPGKAVVESKLAKLIATNPDVHLMFLMDAQGTALVSSEPGVAGVNFKFREYFQQAMQGHAFTTGMVVGATEGKPGVYYSNPVYDASHKVIGAVVLRIKGATLATILDEVQDGAGRVPFMIDGDGVLIHHPRADQLYHSLGTLPVAELAHIVADQRFRRSQIDNLHMDALAHTLVGVTHAGNISYRSTISGVDEHAGYAPVRGHDWVVVVSEPRERFEAPLRHLYQQVLYSVGAVGLVFLVLALLFARSIVRPVARLTDAANALKDGDYERATIKVTSGDEIGRLARTFNVMIDVLRQRDREKRRGRSGAER